MAGNEERYTVQQVIDALEASGGVALGAAMKLGCSCQTVLRYIERHPEIAEAQQLFKQIVSDMAETHVINRVIANDLKACIFWLETKAKDRGFSKLRITAERPAGAAAAPPADETAAKTREELKNLTAEELDEIDRRLDELLTSKSD